MLGLVISNRLRFAGISETAFNHYSMLATIQESWHLGCLGNASDHKHVKPMRRWQGRRGFRRDCYLDKKGHGVSVAFAVRN